MKRMHIHISVDNLDQSIGFYSQLFGAQPSVQQPVSFVARKKASCG